MLIEELIKSGWLKTPEIIEAFKKIKRTDFLPEKRKHLAELNEALPIGFNQTISQPLVVAFMLELLEPQKKQKILDVGSGSGWTSTLLAEIVGDEGKIIAIEIVPELKEFGEKNAVKYNFVSKGRVKFLCSDGSKGCQEEAPFDRILASASVQESDIPQFWKDQLKIDGRIVVPIGSSIWLFHKTSERKFKKKEYPGFIFVPLISKKTNNEIS